MSERGTITQLTSTGFQIVVNKSVSLANIGDSYTVSVQQLEQVSALTNAGVQVTGNSATRTYTTEFRWGTNGSTWSAWLTFNQATVAAQSLTANNLFYFEVRVTRTGSDALGLLVWSQLALNYTINPAATSGHGAIVDLTSQYDLFNLFKQCILFKMPTTTSGKARFEVVDAWPQGMSLGGGVLPIYIHDLRARPSITTMMGGNQSEFRYSMLISIKRINQANGDSYQGAPMDQFAIGIIRRMFDSTTWHVESYDITFKGVAFLAYSFDQWGIVNPELEDRGTYQAENDYFQTFSITFALNTNVVHRYGYSSIN